MDAVEWITDSLTRYTSKTKNRLESILQSDCQYQASDHHRINASEVERTVSMKRGARLRYRNGGTAKLPLSIRRKDRGIPKRHDQVRCLRYGISKRTHQKTHQKDYLPKCQCHDYLPQPRQSSKIYDHPKSVTGIFRYS